MSQPKLYTVRIAAPDVDTLIDSIERLETYVIANNHPHQLTNILTSLQGALADVMLQLLDIKP